MRAQTAVLFLALAAVAVAPVVSAQPKPPVTADATARAKPHFDNGVRLFQDKNFAGALAEFEEAYRIKPGASSLQNIALCLKALFRYSEAADALETLLKRHGAELDDDAKKKVRAAIDELATLVGKVRVSVTPPGARITVDGRPAQPKDGVILVNVGEHVIAAEAPGYERQVRTIRIAGGASVTTIDLALKPVSAIVSVTARDPGAAIAVDGRAKAFGSWEGPIAPGRHFVQVYKQGFRQYEQAFTVAAGETKRIDAPPLQKTEIALDAPPPPPGKDDKPAEQKGWYALAALTVLAPPNGSPNNIEHDSNTSGGGASAGVRAGYRIWTPVAVEALIEGGPMNIEKACHMDCTGGAERDYTINSVRLGGNVRYMSRGENVRFASTLGVGGVRHSVDLKKVTVDDTTELEGGDAAGTDPFFLVELGAQFNLGHVLLEAGAALLLEGTDNIKGDFDGQKDADLYGQDGLATFGLTLKGGWGEWKPAE